MGFNNEIKELEQVPLFGHELLRDILLPEILGKHTNEILYWGGKTIARKFPLVSIDEIRSFFAEAGWGELYLLAEKKHELHFELKGNLVERRLNLKHDTNFKIEAGFLAEQLQLQKNVLAEAVEDIQKRAKTVHFTVRWDEHVDS